MHRRVRDILATNYIDLLGIPPSSTHREIRRALQRAEMEVEMGVGGATREQVDAAKVELSTEEVALEYRVLARWGSDPKLAPLSPDHDTVLGEMRAPRVPPAEIASRWIAAHGDPSLDEALGIELAIGALPLRWVGDVVEDYLSAVLVPGQRAVTASELANLDLWSFPEVRNRLWARLLDCLKAEVSSLREELPEGPNDDILPRSLWPKLAEWHRRARELIEEIGAAQDALRDFEGDEDPLPVAVSSALQDGLVPQVFWFTAPVAAELIKLDAHRAALEAIQEALRLELPADHRLTLINMQGACQIRASVHRKPDRSAEVLGSGRQQTSSNPFAPTRSAPGRSSAQPAPRETFSARPSPTSSGKSLGSSVMSVIRSLVATAVSIGVVVGIGALISGGDDEETSSSSSGTSRPTISTIPTVTPVQASSRDFDVGDCVRRENILGTWSRASCSFVDSAKVLKIAPISDTVYPTNSRWDDLADLNCPYGTKTYLYPTKNGWYNGDRELICLDR